MTYVQSSKITWFAAVVLAFTAGCGSSDESASDPDKDITSPDSPQGAEDFFEPGEPQVGPESEAFPRVEFQTTAGTFIVKLHRDRAPETVENFLEYVEEGFYDGTIFHEVMPDYAVVGGGYSLKEGRILPNREGMIIRNESATALSNKRGTIAMAREQKDADSARCQFFFNLRDNFDLDYAPNDDGQDIWETAGYCAFGEVEGDGLQLLDDISRQPVNSRDNLDRVPVELITITSASKL